jgi:predicted RNA-binding protein YlqC (UPF0109 family)
MKELIGYIAQALVDHPEKVTVTEVEGNQTSVLELKVAKEDLGKVIGKQGRTARAMRTILSAASAKVKKRTSWRLSNSVVGKNDFLRWKNCRHPRAPGKCKGVMFCRVLLPFQAGRFGTGEEYPGAGENV